VRWAQLLPPTTRQTANRRRQSPTTSKTHGNPAAAGTNRAFARRDFTPTIPICGGPYLIAPEEATMEFIKDGLFWLAGIPLLFILVFALFLHPG
jgi:hypothetical protein